MQQIDLQKPDIPQIVCKTDKLQIEYIIIDEELENQRDRLCCFKCSIGKNCLFLGEAKEKYEAKFIEATSRQHNQIRQDIENLMSFFSKDESKTITQALQGISLNINQIQQDCLYQNRKFQSRNRLHTFENLNLFAEYIAYEKNTEKQENLYQIYCEKTLKDLINLCKTKLQDTQILAEKIKTIASKMEKKLELIPNTNQEKYKDICNEMSKEFVQYQKDNVYFEEISFMEELKDMSSKITDKISSIFEQILSQFQKNLAYIIQQNNISNEQQSEQLKQEWSFCCNPVLEKNVVEDFQNQFNNLADLISIKKFQNQIDNANFFSILDSQENQFVQFIENEQNFFYLHDHSKIIQQTCELNSRKKKFKQQPVQITLQQNKFYQDFKISQDSSWFVALSIFNQHQYIEIWETTSKANQNKLYEIIYQTSGEKVKQLEVPNNLIFITLQSNSFTIWNKKVKEIRPTTINFDSVGFVAASFDPEKWLLIIQQNYGGKILLYKFQNEIEKITKIELSVQKIHPNIQYNIHFLNQDLNNFLISYQEGLINIHQFNQKNKELKFIAQERLQKGKFFYGTGQYNFGIIHQNNLYISLYQVIQNKENQEKFTICKIINVYEMGTCIEAKFSQSGKYLAVLNKTVQGKNRLNVQYKQIIYKQQRKIFTQQLTKYIGDLSKNKVGILRMLLNQ